MMLPILLALPPLVLHCRADDVATCAETANAADLGSPGQPASFTRPSWRRCEWLRAFGCHPDGSADSQQYPALCCCPPDRPCREPDAWHQVGASRPLGTSPVCRACPSSYLMWRAQWGSAADILIAGMLIGTPRLALLMLLACRSNLVWELGIFSQSEKLRHRLVSEMLISNVALVKYFLRANGHDSFWWILAVVHSLAVQVVNEFMFVARPKCMSAEFSHTLWTMYLSCGCMGTIAVAHSVNGGGARSGFATGLLNALLVYYAARAALSPSHYFSERRYFMAGLHLALLIGVLSLSHRILFDTVTLFLVTCPVGWVAVKLTAEARDIMADLVPFWKQGPTIVIDRSRFVQSSVEQLKQLLPDQLANGPPLIVYADVVGGETGIDTGGLRRDWLGHLANELFNPARGLVEYETVHGTPFARLRKGGSLQELEAMGKVLGLALRDAQPLGVDICAPFAHCLAHPQLPLVVETVRRLVPDGNIRHGQHVEPQAVDCSADCSADGMPSLGTIANRNAFAAFCSRSFRLHRRSARVRAMAELARLGFSREWLQWVSRDEYNYYQACLAGPSHILDHAVDIRAVDEEAPESDEVLSVPKLREHMAHRALQVLIVDVAAELLAVWRGLHSIPGVVLPSLSEEARGSKRRRGIIEGENLLNQIDEHNSKRRRVADVQAQMPQRTRTGKDSSVAGSICGDSTVKSQVPSIPSGCTSSLADAAKNDASGAVELSCLQRQLAGSRTVSVAELRACTEYAPQGAELLSEGRRVLEWFWSYVESLDLAGRSALLEWITGFRRLPVGGFPPPHTRMTIFLTDMADDGRLPCAHTCGLQLDLPRGYSSQAVLCRRLSEATAQRQFHIA
eukprot:gnl/TRDRNA2_/TRDRNA2_181189_c0_seq1.p1 gnl/TRDRNA2_/TRDRNA2_181189_c0~~gnl/TRDRNA2_/TRDRNA2_181189_c0_seq1.p1  ORF type:complete len:854 (+),score=81.86 gnl/TRDRNA2_/TRDRNA2_181189_c0_seq1:78-2639(+)